MRVLIYGAGSTGCYIGGQCVKAKVDVSLLCRERIKHELSEAGHLRLSNYRDEHTELSVPAIYTDLNDLTNEPVFDLCLVTLKCVHLEGALEDLVALASTGCEMHFLQNGLNAYRTFPALKNTTHHLYSGIIPFNVLAQGNGRFHQGTEGALQLQQTQRTDTLKRHFTEAGLEVELYNNMQTVVYGKLLLNLNNALNALSDMPLKQQLEHGGLRTVLASAMHEYLNVCSALDQKLEISAPLPPKLLPVVLSLPTPLFKIVAKKMLAIDPLARSSMWEDIQAGRTTEIDYLNGAVVRLGHELGVSCRTNALICELIKKEEAGDDITIDALLKANSAATST